MKKITINCYTDPGHGWYKVPLSVLDKIGIRGFITPYSYMRGDHAYLEEDLDASTLIQRLKHLGVSVKIKEFHTDRTSKIRSYASYKV